MNPKNIFHSHMNIIYAVNSQSLGNSVKLPIAAKLGFPDAIFLITFN
jgi:hypothetical protein